MCRKSIHCLCWRTLAFLARVPLEFRLSFLLVSSIERMLAIKSQSHKASLPQGSLNVSKEFLLIIFRLITRIACLGRRRRTQSRAEQNPTPRQDQTKNRPDNKSRDAKAPEAREKSTDRPRRRRNRRGQDGEKKSGSDAPTA